MPDRFPAAVVGVCLLSVAAPAAAQVTFTFDKHPSIHFGKVLNVDGRVQVQTDWRDFPLEPATDPKRVFDLRRARVGIGGTFLTHFGYQIERELDDPITPWRDVYVDASLLRSVQIRGGHFKIPFGLDQLASAMDLDFNYRSLAGAYLAPGRDTGVMALGRLIKGVVKYEAGVFRQGGANVRSSERAGAQSDRTFAGHLVVKPWDNSKTLRSLRSLSAGIAYTDGRLPEGLNSLRGKTVPGDEFFERVYVKGRRQRVGGEFQWRPGPTSVQGEFIRASDQRRNQGVDDENLPDVVAHGWYVSGTWLVTGERKMDTITPTRPFLKRGIGAVELAGRVEHLGSGGGSQARNSFPTPRAASVPARTDDVWTAGANWYLNKFIKLQANVIRGERRAGDAVIPGQGALWSRTVRIQFEL